MHQTAHFGIDYWHVKCIWKCHSWSGWFWLINWWKPSHIEIAFHSEQYNSRTWFVLMITTGARNQLSRVYHAMLNCLNKYVYLNRTFKHSMRMKMTNVCIQHRKLWEPIVNQPSTFHSVHHFLLSNSKRLNVFFFGTQISFKCISIAWNWYSKRFVSFMRTSSLSKWMWNDRVVVVFLHTLHIPYFGHIDKRKQILLIFLWWFQAWKFLLFDDTKQTK